MSRKKRNRGHLRKECACLTKDELEYCQAVRNLDRLRTWDGCIPRRKRNQLEQYFSHPNQRVRAYALEIEKENAWRRAEQRLYDDLDECLMELAEATPLPEFDNIGDEIPF